MNDVLKNIFESGILSESEVDTIVTMTKKQEVLKIHKAKISQGKGKDKRYFTRVNGKKITSATEKGLIDKLHDHYYSGLNSICIESFWQEWFDYKYKVSNRPSNVKRIWRDFQKYYLEDPLSEDFIRIPYKNITPYDVKLWASQLIKKHKLTRKQYGNIMVPLRQSIDLLVDRGILQTNPARNITIDRGLFSPEDEKPDSQTQIFFEDEVLLILTEAYKRASEYNDETYLAIPLCLYSGIRPGECFGLKKSDVNRKNNSLCIRRSLVEGADGKYKVEDYLKKNAKPRTIVVPDSVFDTVDMISRIRNTKANSRCEPEEANTNWLFNVKYPGNVDRKLYRICDDLGLVRRSLNKLRKTHISILLNNGFDLDFVRKRAGHTNIQTTLNNYTFSTTRDVDLVKRMEQCVPHL